MKKILFILTIAIVSAFVSIGQENNELNKTIAQSFFRIAQKPGTEALLVDYLSSIPAKNDTLYAFIFHPMMCPRCEAEINMWFEMLYDINPEIETALIAIYPTKKAANRYFNMKGFESRYFMVDTSEQYRNIFAFSADPPRVTYLIKIDKKNGRLISGGDFQMVNPTIALQLYQQTEHQPYYGKDWEGSLSYFARQQPCHGQTQAPAKILRFEEKETFPISNITYASVGNNMMSFVDELENKVYLFSIENNKMQFMNAFMPDSLEEMLFVDPKIGKERYMKMKQNNEVIAMCIDTKIIDKNLLSFTTSLPNLILADDGVVDYYNKASALVCGLNSKESDRQLIAFNFKGTNPNYFTGHEYYDYIKDKEQFIFIMQRYCWPLGDEDISRETDPFMNPFSSDFYKETPLYIVYQKDSIIERFGFLDPIYKKTKTGYTFINPRMNNNGKILAVTCGTSGMIHLYDLNNLKTPFSSFKTFDVDTSVMHIDTTLEYSIDYLYQFEDFFFLRTIEDLLVCDNSVCCLSKEDNCFYFKEYTFEGKLQHSFSINTELDGSPLQEAGLCLLNGKPQIYGTFRDQEGVKIAFYQTK